jgi:hypothetical protein
LNKIWLLLFFSILMGSFANAGPFDFLERNPPPVFSELDTAAQTSIRAALTDGAEIPAKFWPWMELQASSVQSVPALRQMIATLSVRNSKFAAKVKAICARVFANSKGSEALRQLLASNELGDVKTVFEIARVVETMPTPLANHMVLPATRAQAKRLLMSHSQENIASVFKYYNKFPDQLSPEVFREVILGPLQTVFNVEADKGGVLNDSGRVSVAHYLFFFLKDNSFWPRSIAFEKEVFDPLLDTSNPELNNVRDHFERFGMLTTRFRAYRSMRAIVPTSPAAPEPTAPIGDSLRDQFERMKRNLGRPAFEAECAGENFWSKSFGEYLTRIMEHPSRQGRVKAHLDTAQFSLLLTVLQRKPYTDFPAVKTLLASETFKQRLYFEVAVTDAVDARIVAYVMKDPALSHDSRFTRGLQSKLAQARPAVDYTDSAPHRALALALTEAPEVLAIPEWKNLVINHGLASPTTDVSVGFVASLELITRFYDSAAKEHALDAAEEFGKKYPQQIGKFGMLGADSPLLQKALAHTTFEQAKSVANGHQVTSADLVFLARYAVGHPNESTDLFAPDRHLSAQVTEGILPILNENPEAIGMPVVMDLIKRFLDRPTNGKEGKEKLVALMVEHPDTIGKEILPLFHLDRRGEMARIFSQVAPNAPAAAELWQQFQKGEKPNVARARLKLESADHLEMSTLRAEVTANNRLTIEGIQTCLQDEQLVKGLLVHISAMPLQQAKTACFLLGNEAFDDHREVLLKVLREMPAAELDKLGSLFPNLQPSHPEVNFFYAIDEVLLERANELPHTMAILSKQADKPESALRRLYGKMATTVGLVPHAKTSIIAGAAESCHKAIDTVVETAPPSDIAEP